MTNTAGLATAKRAAERRIGGATGRTYRSPRLRAVEAGSGIAIDGNTGEVLFAKEEHRPMFPASMTKIVTTMLLLEACEPDEIIVPGDEIYPSESGESLAGLVVGERTTAGRLAAAMMLASGNDAARTAARYVASKHCGRRLESGAAFAYFAELMNWKAEAMGASRTRFVNPHGLQHPLQTTTAADMAAIARRALRNDAFRELAGRDVCAEGRYQNRNLLLRSDSPFFLPGATGLKTGYTSAAGYCLAASAMTEGKETIAVVLCSTKDGRWRDARRLLAAGSAISL